jgi:hypothetical protein
MEMLQQVLGKLESNIRLLSDHDNYDAIVKTWGELAKRYETYQPPKGGNEYYEYLYSTSSIDLSNYADDIEKFLT